MSAKHHNLKSKAHKGTRPVTKERSFLAKFWHFIWHDDSIYSWLANLLIAFILIKFIIYPLLGAVLGAELPVVAVISGSMDHNANKLCLQRSIFDGSCLKYDPELSELCGNEQSLDVKNTFDNYWQQCGDWYEDIGITSEEFSDYPFKNGFQKGDVIILKGVEAADLEQGDVLVFASNRPYPIIHRVVKVSYDETDESYLFATKGDHNPYQIQTSDLDETRITEAQIMGKGVGKIPYVGYVKIWFVELLRFFGVTAV